MIRLVVFETYPLYHIGIRKVFNGSSHIYVAGNTSDAAALFPMLADTEADVILLGVNPCDNQMCVDIARRIRHDYPLLKILAFADEKTEQTVRLMMEADIHGCIGKWADRNELGNAIQQLGESDG